MSLAYNIGKMIRSFGLGTKHVAVTTGKGAAKGFRHLNAGLTGSDEPDTPKARTQPKSKYRRVRA